MTHQPRMLAGELTRTTALRVVLDTAATAAVDLPARLFRRGRTGPGDPLFTVPDSALAREALDEARETLRPSILAHSLRCWQWGMALARVDSATPDAEALFVSSVLHDLELGAGADSHIGCFALLGAERAVTDRLRPGAPIAGHARQWQCHERQFGVAPRVRRRCCPTAIRIRSPRRDGPRSSCTTRGQANSCARFRSTSGQRTRIDADEFDIRTCSGDSIHVHGEPAASRRSKVPFTGIHLAIVQE